MSGFREPPSREALLGMIAENPRSLEGQVESQWLDFKREPHLKPEGRTRDEHRFELAKDVTAMANAGGGLIVWGVGERRDPEAARRFIGELSPIRDGIVEESQIWNTLREWIFPTRIDLKVLEKPVEGGGSLWIIDIQRQALGSLPYLVVREWPPGKDSRSAGRGHFTMYERRGTDNVYIPPAEMHPWIHAGYHGLGGSAGIAAIVGPGTTGGGLGASSPWGPIAGAADSLVSLDEALADELDNLDVDASSEAYYFLQLFPTREERLAGFFDEGPEGFLQSFASFQPCRPNGFSPFSRYGVVERTAKNALRRGLESKGGILIQDQGLTTSVCCQATLTWASEKRAPPGNLIINPVALPEFTLDVSRFFLEHVHARAGNAKPRDFAWRVGMKGLGGEVPVYLPKGRPDVPLHYFWEFYKPHTTPDFTSTLHTSQTAAPERLAFEILVEVFHAFGYGSDAIPFRSGDKIDVEALTKLR